MDKKSDFTFSEDFDTAYLQRNYADKLSLLDKMFEIFLKDIELVLENLNDAVNSHDYETCEKICHKIKTNFAHIGLPALHQKVALLESKAKIKEPKLQEFYDSQKLNLAVKSVIFEKQRLTTHLSI